MYKKSARFYDYLYHFKDYDSESLLIKRLINERHPRAASLLDLACGTGQFLSRFQDSFAADGLDLSPELLAIARSRCPRASLYQGNMQDFVLPRRYDVITCLFSSIIYVKEDGLNKMLQSIARHLAPGGLLIMEPWFSPDEFWPNHIKLNNFQQPNLAIAWMYVGRHEGKIAIVDIHFLVATKSGVETFTELHELALFTHQDYEMAFSNAALDAEFVPTGKHGLFLGKSNT